MTQTYQLTGMTCGNCESNVKAALLGVNGVSDVVVSKDKNEAKITMDGPIPILEFKKVLDQKYDISALEPMIESTAKKSWLETYKPVLLIFIYLFSITGIIELTGENFNGLRWMRHFMGGFFLTFSFFKMLNLQGFKESYAMYDIVASRWPTWGYIYPFVELILGVLFLINFDPIITNSITLVVMSVSILGVLQSVLNRKKIKCACLGDVFNLPMSTVTIIEDGLMIAMSLAMLIMALS